MKKNIIIISMLVIVVFGYNYWINTPQYSLLQIQKSVDTKDRVLFDKYVDTNGIIEETVEDLSKLFIEETDTDESSEHSLFDPQVLAAGLVSLFQPAIENAIEESFDEFWEDEVETAQPKEPESHFKNDLNSFQMTYLKKEGKIAKVGLESEDPDSGEVLKLEFKLNKIENYWRITQISNLDELLKQNMDEVGELINLDT
jgi:hypothetical protein